MATETEIEMQLDLFVEMMNDEQADWDLYDPLFADPLFADKSETKNETKRDESDPTPSEEEQLELEQDLIEIALETTRRNYTFVYASPTKKLFQKCQ
jgi:hypothetical protein